MYKTATGYQRWYPIFFKDYHGLNRDTTLRLMRACGHFCFEPRWSAHPDRSDPVCCACFTVQYGCCTVCKVGQP